MRRREFIAGLGSAGAMPNATRAQQRERIRQIGILAPSDENSYAAKVLWPLFPQGLEALGWVNGRNLRIEHRWGGGNVDRIRTLARELSDLRPDVIVVSTGVATKAVQEQTRDIPIIFVYAGDPVANGLLTNIARPEGNTTGVTDLFASIGGKWLELLKEAIPPLARVALIFHPAFRPEFMLAAAEAAAARYSVKTGKYPPAEPGALMSEPLKAAWGGRGPAPSSNDRNAEQVARRHRYLARISIWSDRQWRT